MDTDIVFFNDFKERLANGKVPNSFWVTCYPVTDEFFSKLNTEDYKIENFRTVNELEKAGFNSMKFEYDQKGYYSEYCCEYLTQPYTQYITRYVNNVPYHVVGTQRYTYLSAQMNYRYTNVSSADIHVTQESGMNAAGCVNYVPEKQKFLVHFFNHTALPAEPDFTFSDGSKNDGTTLYMGYVPNKETMVCNMAQTGIHNSIYPIYGTGFRGFVFADTSGNLINYYDFKQPIDFDGGSFVYEFPETWTITNTDGVSAKWATFIDLE